MKKRSYSRRSKPSSPIQKVAREFTVQESSELLDFLITHIKNKGRNAIKSLLYHQQVWVDDKPETAYNYMLQPGQIVSIHKERPQEETSFNGLSIIHEDENLIVIHKNAGLLAISSSRETMRTAYRQLTAHVRRDDPNARIFVVHRLDRDTSGVMMFAKSKDIQQALQNNWHDVVQERKYIALVEGEVKNKEGKISSWLKETKTLKMYSSPYPHDGQHAVTHYNVLKSNGDFSLLEIWLKTGRKNQIRVHMEDIGHPIVGDKKYGSKINSIGRLGLHAQVLAFKHPATGQLMRFESKLPKAFTAAVSLKTE